MVEVPKVPSSSQRKDRVDNFEVMLSILKDAERVDFKTSYFWMKLPSTSRTQQKWSGILIVNQL